MSSNQQRQALLLLRLDRIVGLLCLGILLFLLSDHLINASSPSCRYHDVNIDLSSRHVDWHLCHRKSLEEKHNINGVHLSSSSFILGDPSVSNKRKKNGTPPFFYKENCFMASKVPGTILTNMVQNNHSRTMFPDISQEDLFMDDNLRHVPDIAQAGKDHYTYYWIASLNLAAFLKTHGSRSQRVGNLNANNINNTRSDEVMMIDKTLESCDIRLKIRSLNYRGTVFSGGMEIAPENPSILRSPWKRRRRHKDEPSNSTIGAAVGMFHRWSYLLRQNTTLSNNKNSKSSSSTSETMTIVILIEPPDYPGNVTGQQGGDHNIAKNAAIQQSVVGWDWIRGTPDRNTGLWDQVSLEFVDSHMEIRDVHVQILSNITSRHPEYADIGITIDILHSEGPEHFLRFGCPDSVDDDEDKELFRIVVDVSETTPPLSLSYQVSYNDLKTTCNSTLFGNKKCHTTIPLPPLQMANPATWWPHNYGNPHLYHLTAKLLNAHCPSLHGNNNEVVHSQKTVKFGVRTISSYVDTAVTNGRVFVCNGQKVFLQGGNWVGTDQFHRFSTSVSRYQNEVRLHKAMGLNVIRVWGGGITERPEFYEATDEEGILVIQEFWMTGDNNGRWAGSYNYPVDHDVYLACVQDVILMLRNHPSLMLWVGGNELYPRGQSPPRHIASQMKSMIEKLDPGRSYIASSMSNYTNYDPSFALAPKDGPYGFLSPFRFYQRNPGLKFWNGTLANNLKIGFQPEIGSSSTPDYREIRLFLSNAYAEDFPTKNDKEVPSMFQYHNYLPYTDDMGWDHIYDAYGPPSNMSEYCFRAQLAQYNQFKGLMEGFQRHMWTYYTAVLLWKTQSPWPSFRGFTYSWWLEPTGGFYGIRAALEGGQPLHVQLANWTRETSVCIVNRSPENFDKDNDGIVFSLTSQWWDLNGTLIKTKVHNIDGYKVLLNTVYTLHIEDFTFPTQATLGVSYLRLVLDSPTDPTVCLRGKYMGNDYVSPYGCSFNDYYLSDPEKHQNFTGLGDWRLKSSDLLRLHVKCFQDNTNHSELFIQVTNPNKALALQTRIRVDDIRMKYFYSSQFVSLLPFERRNLTIKEMVGDGSKHTYHHSKQILLLIDGINIRPEKCACETIFETNSQDNQSRN